SVSGIAVGVPVLDGATLVLVSGTDLSTGSRTVALVDADGPGVSRVETATSRGTSEATYTFDGAPVVGTLDADVVRRHATAGLAAWGAGLVEGARDLTAGYIRDRKQFGRP